MKLKMKLKEFLQDKKLSAVELVNCEGNQIINIYIDTVCFGLDIDTTNLGSGTPLEYRTDFTLEGDILSVSDFFINTNDIEML